MAAMKNVIHLAVLAAWAVAGIVFTFSGLFTPAHTLLEVLSYWLWFAGFAGLTTVVVGQFEKPVAPLILHAAAFMVLQVIPRVFPLSLLRLGLDLLTR